MAWPTLAPLIGTGACPLPAPPARQVNNAGMAGLEWDQDLFDRTMATNFLGVLDLTQQLLPALSPGGLIIMVSSSEWRAAATRERTRRAMLLHAAVFDMVSSCPNPGAAPGHHMNAPNVV